LPRQNRTKKPSPSGDVFLDVDQLSERWRLSRKTLYNKNSNGTGPPFVRLGGAVRYRLRDIEAYEASHIIDRQAVAG
jgi:predicted DNA-binding transcriptional regulator AlpA